MHYDVITYALIIEVLAIMSPGPDFFIVLRNAISHSFSAGMYTALGITLGSTIEFIIGIFGVAEIIAKSALLFNIIKFTGATYLAFLGIKSIMSKVKLAEPNLVDDELHKDINFYYFKTGLFCNLTNPKAYMFIIALATYISSHGNLLKDGFFVIIGSGIYTILWFSLVSLLFGNAHTRRIFYRQQRLINILFGIVLLYVASKFFTLH